jgi:hypothetical protein
MADRKFTPPTKFPAEYVAGNGNKVTILGRGPHEVFPLIGYDANGYAATWTELGEYYLGRQSQGDLHDTPKRITTWHNVYGDWISPQRSTRSDADLGDHSEGYLAEERFCVYRIERDEDGGNFEIFVEDV